MSSTPVQYSESDVEQLLDGMERDFALAAFHNAGGVAVIVPAKPPPPPTPRTRRRKPTLRSVARQAAKAGIPVARFDVRADGIGVIPGTRDEAPACDDGDEWAGVLAR